MSIKESAIALGFFDGVHTAHQKIIACAVEYAKLNNLSPIALSFDRSPMEVLSPESVSYLTDNSDKKAIISSLGAKTEFLTASETLLNMEAEVFVREILVGKFNMKYAVCGYNYRFGKGGKGDTSLLTKCGEKYGFGVKIMEALTLHGESVSSSRVRRLLADGNISGANELLGRNFSVSGTVCEGKHLGRSLGFPTANVFLHQSMTMPASGVYKTIVTLNGEKYKAITNVGINPTVGGEKLHTETHIIGFDGDIYGKNINIEFTDFIRSEMEFQSVDELKRRINDDISAL